MRSAKKEHINFILAVGGGSVIDSAKAIAAGVKYDGDIWELYEGKGTLKEALPVGGLSLQYQQLVVKLAWDQ